MGELSDSQLYEGKRDEEEDEGDVSAFPAPDVGNLYNVLYQNFQNERIGTTVQARSTVEAFRELEAWPDVKWVIELEQIKDKSWKEQITESVKDEEEDEGDVSGFKRPDDQEFHGIRYSDIVSEYFDQGEPTDIRVFVTGYLLRFIPINNFVTIRNNRPEMNKLYQDITDRIYRQRKEMLDV